MARTDENGRYLYPTENWANGRMRRRGDQRPSEDEEPRTQYAMLFGKGKRGAELQYGGPEYERLAGSGFGARGGETRAGAVGPEAIQARKAPTQAMGQPWEIGTINWRKMDKRQRRSMKGVDREMSIRDYVDMVTMPVELFTGFSYTEGMAKGMEKAMEFVVDQKKKKGETHMEGLDAEGNARMMPLDEINPAEQVERRFSRVEGMVGKIKFKGKQPGPQKTQELEKPPTSWINAP